ncbi:MAG TPA: hypothetical protein VFU85_00900, partial [Nocardioides sp.]|nr:hypothetical protein [Nocardioides sp.]
GQTSQFLVTAGGATDTKVGGSSEAGAASVVMSWTLSGSIAWNVSGLSIPADGTIPPLDARVTQLPIELVSSPTPAARVSQLPIELVSSPTPAARASQLAVEIVSGAVVPPAGLTRVQATAKVEASAPTLTIVFTTPPSLGNGIIVPVISYNTTAPPRRCVDNYGNAYVRVVGPSTGGGPIATQFYCPKVLATGASFTITVTLHTSTWVVGNAIEVSGVGDGLMVDQFAAASGSSTTPASGSTPALTASEVFVVGAHANNSVQASITVAVVSPVWVQEFESLPNTYTSGEADSRVLTGAAGTTTSISWTLAATGLWSALLVAYRASAATSGLTRVQVTAKYSATSSTSHTLPFGTPPTVGNGIVIPIATYMSGGNGAPPITVVDNQGHTFRLAAYVKGVSSDIPNASIFFLPTLTAVAGAYSVTITFGSGASAYVLACGIEVAGVGGGLNVATAVSLGSPSSTTAPSTGTSLASAVAELFDVAVVAMTSGKASITVEAVSPVWTQEVEELSGSNAPGEADSRLRTSQVGVTQACSWTLNATDHGAAALVGFFATAGAAPGGTASRLTQFVAETLILPAPPAARATQFLAETLSSLSATIAPSRLTQFLAEVLTAPTGTQLTQFLAEVLSQVPGPPVRITQASLDILVTSLLGPARLTQTALEAFTWSPIPTRVSHAALEAFLRPPAPPTRISQTALELFLGPPPSNVRMTQAVVELFVILPPCVPANFPVEDAGPGGSCASGLLP